MNEPMPVLPEQSEGASKRETDKERERERERERDNERETSYSSSAGTHMTVCVGHRLLASTHTRIESSTQRR